MVKKMILALLISISIGVNAQDNVGIGTGANPPDSSAKLEIKSTSQGLLIPRMTTADRDAIVSPANGLQIYNTGENCVQVYDGTVWDCLTTSLDVADGSETKVTAGSNVTVTGTGILADPYVITATEVDGSVTNEVNLAFSLNGTSLQITDANGMLSADMSSFATDAEVADAITTSAADGSETRINAGANVTVTGTGTVSAPYVIAATAASVDGSETRVNAGTNVTVTGTGTTASPYVVNAASEVDGSVTNEVNTAFALSGTTLGITDANSTLTADLSSFATDAEVADAITTSAADGSETVVNAGSNITVSGAGTTASPYVIAAIAGAADGSETVVNAGTNITVSGTGTTANPYVVNAASEVDGSVTNELTDLSLSGTTLTLTNPATGGNSVDLSAVGVEPWNKVGGTVAATANTDDAYLAGKGVIGGTDVLTYTDTVNGGVVTDATLSIHGAIVTLNSVYADYVFEDYLDGTSTIKEDYKFKTLAEVDNFIKANKHLPGVTSIKDLQKTANGYAVNISALSVQVLEKTEELYLHTIDQQKTIDALVKENEALKTRLAKIEKALGL